MRGAWLVALLLVAGAGTAPAAEWTKAEQEALLAAIEDYNFGDLESAIQGLQPLAKQHPDDPRVLRYLALSLSEAGRHAEAKRVFARWRQAAGERAMQDRDAVLAYARSLRASGDADAAVRTLHGWMGQHPDDLEVETELGAALVAAGRLDEGRALWQGVWKRVRAPGLKAAAAYHLAWIAARKGEQDGAKRWARRAVALDPQGPYGKSAATLLASLERDRGWHGEIALGAERTSNVDLLPDIARPQQGKSRSDFFGTAHLGIRWRGDRGLAEYMLEAQKYAKRSDYDLLMHTLRAGLNVRGFTVAPVLEYVTLARQRLFWGAGLDLAWTRASWRVAYTLRSRSFTKDFGPQHANLSRLGGLVHELGLERTFASDADRFVAGLTAHLEQTKGDAVHPKTDDFLQWGVDLAWTHANGPWDASAQLSGWLRSYRRQDPIAGRKRTDRFVLVGGELGRSFGEEARQRLALSLHWQRNDSTFKPPSVPAALDKTFTEWSAGARWSWQW